jgi:hypothetical protein
VLAMLADGIDVDSATGWDADVAVDTSAGADTDTDSGAGAGAGFSCSLACPIDAPANMQSTIIIKNEILRMTLNLRILNILDCCRAGGSVSIDHHPSR